MIALRNPILVDQGAASAADPAFAVIEEHRAAYAAWTPLALALNSLPPDDPAYAAAEDAERDPGDRERGAFAALMTVQPTTLAGLAALAEYLPTAIRQTSTYDEATEGERALRSVAAAMAALVPAAVSSPAEPDPVFDAIAAYETAWRAVEAASDAEVADRVGTLMSGAYRHLRATRPTTPAGYAALADHLARHIEREPGYGNTVGEHVAAMLIAGRGALRGGTPPMAGPSPRLLALIDEWQSLGRQVALEEDAEKATALSRQHTAVQIAIYRWPSASIADLAAKAPLFLDEMAEAAPVPAEGADPAESPEGAAWHGILRDLAALSQAPPAAEAAIAPPCASAPLAGAEAPTLAAMSIGELADLYDVSLRASEQLAALACLPGCSGEDRARVGTVLDLEADRFGDLSVDCAEEMKSRRPATDEDRADRASILARHAARFHAWGDLAALAIEASADVGGRR